MHAPVNYVTIGVKPFPETLLTYHQLHTMEQISLKFQSTYRDMHDEFVLLAQYKFLSL